MDNITKYFLILIILLLTLNILLVPTKKIKENYDNKQKKLKSISFKAAPTTSEKLVFSNTNGDLNTYTQDEAFENGIKLKNTISFNDWTISQDSSKNLCFKRNDQTKNFCLTSNDTNKNYSLKLGDTVLDENSLKKQKHLDLYAGFACNGDGGTLLLYAGEYSLVALENVNPWPEGWTNDRWDIIYVNKGFKITVYNDNMSGTQAVLENTDSDIPKRFVLSNYNLKDALSSYKAEWIGFN